MKISTMKLIFLVQKQISEKCFQILCCFVNTCLQVRIVLTIKEENSHFTGVLFS